MRHPWIVGFCGAVIVIILWEWLVLLFPRLYTNLDENGTARELNICYEYMKACHEENEELWRYVDVLRASTTPDMIYNMQNVPKENKNANALEKRYEEDILRDRSLSNDVLDYLQMDFPKKLLSLYGTDKAISILKGARTISIMDECSSIYQFLPHLNPHNSTTLLPMKANSKCYNIMAESNTQLEKDGSKGKIYLVSTDSKLLKMNQVILINLEYGTFSDNDYLLEWLEDLPYMVECVILYKKSLLDSKWNEKDANRQKEVEETLETFLSTHLRWSMFHEPFDFDYISSNKIWILKGLHAPNIRKLQSLQFPTSCMNSKYFVANPSNAGIDYNNITYIIS
jgi:hypothetical protein